MHRCLMLPPVSLTVPFSQLLLCEVCRHYEWMNEWVSGRIIRSVIHIIFEMCRYTNKKLIRRWDSERELSLRRHHTRTIKYTTWGSYIANRKYQLEAKHQNIVVNWNLDDKLKVRNGNVKWYTGSFVFTREMNLVTHKLHRSICCRSRLLINKFNAQASG